MTTPKLFHQGFKISYFSITKIASFLSANFCNGIETEVSVPISSRNFFPESIAALYSP